MSILEAYHICTKCGKRYTDGIHKTCDYCREKMRIYHEKHRENIMESVRKFRAEHKEMGLCIYCNSPAEHGKSMCKIHAERERMRYKKRGKISNE